MPYDAIVWLALRGREPQLRRRPLRPGLRHRRLTGDAGTGALESGEGERRGPIRDAAAQALPFAASSFDLAPGQFEPLRPSPERASLARPVKDSIAAQLNGGGLGLINTALYRIAAGPDYSADFYDITAGNSQADPSVAGYPATVGWDPVTGLGTPNAANLIPDLVAASHQGRSPDAESERARVWRGGSASSPLRLPLSALSAPPRWPASAVDIRSLPRRLQFRLAHPTPVAPVMCRASPSRSGWIDAELYRAAPSVVSKSEPVRPDSE